MPKILRLINRFNVGGISYNVAYLSKFISSDFETRVIGGTIEPGEAHSGYIFQNLGIEYRIVPHMRRDINIFRDIRTLVYLIRELYRFNPDIIHTHASKAGLLGRVAVLFYFRKKILVVHTFHGNVFDGYFGKIKRLFVLSVERVLAKFTDSIVAISEKQKSDLVNTYRIANRHKIRVIPLGFDLNPFLSSGITERNNFRGEFSIPDATIVLTIVGRLVPIKNHHLFLEVIHMLKNKFSRNILGLIIGDGESRSSIVNYSNFLGLSSDVMYFPGIDVVFTSWRRDLASIYSGSDFVLLTSKNEGTPVSIIEAMASGKPVLCTNVGGVVDVIYEGTGYICPDNPISFCSIINKLIDDIELRNNIGRRARERVQSVFKYERLCSDMDRLYNDLLILKKM